MGIFELTTGGAIGMLGAGLAVCLAGAGICIVFSENLSGGTVS